MEKIAEIQDALPWKILKSGSPRQRKNYENLAIKSQDCKMEERIIFRSRGRPPIRNDAKAFCLFLEESVVEKADAEASRLGISRSEFFTDVLDWYFREESHRLGKVKELEKRVKELEKELEKEREKNEKLTKKLNQLLGKPENSEEEELMRKKPSEMTPEEFAILKERIKKTREKMKARRWL
ncbi:MAG: hypothetical protein DRO04_00945 [Candidatus Iainarchaeum archaeon]|uniref:Uncharacterized protein n=1 Tax=Candidatus Iainarchaeum sp. TaxID=3101447 RepID=A0A497JJ73_9ARCH|nr:MAG: hypothetical protein DRO04_00945 [Candidatus Diapherotrites archaeon]